MDKPKESRQVKHRNARMRAMGNMVNGGGKTLTDAEFRLVVFYLWNENNTTQTTWHGIMAISKANTKCRRSTIYTRNRLVKLGILVKIHDNDRSTGEFGVDLSHAIFQDESRTIKRRRKPKPTPDEIVQPDALPSANECTRLVQLPTSPSANGCTQTMKGTMKVTKEENPLVSPNGENQLPADKRRSLVKSSQARRGNTAAYLTKYKGEPT